MNKAKKIIVLLLLAVTCSFANWLGKTSEPELRTKIDGKTFYLISTPEELAWFAAQVNSGKTEINAKLSDDIVLWEDSLTSSSEATNWQPIGDSLTNSFNGIFDGDNHKIRGVYINKELETYRSGQSDSICLGLFGSLGVDGLVKNLNVENAYLKISVTTYNNSSNIGGVIGVNEGHVKNVSVKGTFAAGGNVGGLIGRNKGYVEEASFNGSILSVYGKIGGITGYNSGSLKDAVSSGDIQSTSSDNVSSIGGIAGYVENGLDIEDCENNANITGKGKNSRNVLERTFVGGIAGYVINTLSIRNCTNNGTLNSTERDACLGGIVGYAESTTIDNCKNEANYDDHVVVSFAGIIGSGKSVIVRNCVNNGSIILTGESNDAAGIALDIDSTSTIDNCVNNGVVKAFYTAAGIVHYGSGNVINCVNNDSIVGVFNAAGIAGSARVVENCVNNGAVSANDNATRSSFSSVNVGGIVSSWADTIKMCTNNGNVFVTESFKVAYGADGNRININVSAGGISADAPAKISKCINKGLVSTSFEFSHTSTTNYGSNGDCRRSSYVGGIAGGIYGDGLITDSYNLASVNASYRFGGSYLYDNCLYVGGIVGYTRDDNVVKNVYSAADSITGQISGGLKNHIYKGALFGQLYKKAQINNVYYDSKVKNLDVPIGDTTSVDTVNVLGLSTSDMQNGQFAWSLNTTAGTQKNSSIWSRKDGYPIFADDENLPIYSVTFDDDGATNYYKYIYKYTDNKGHVSIPDNQSPADGYRFVSWVKENGDVFDERQIASEDMIVSALYAETAAKVYVVTFEYPSGTEIASLLTNDKGSLDSLPESPMLNENYLFKGWFDSSSSRVTTSTVFTSNTIVEAVYESLSSSSVKSSSSSSSETKTSSSSSVKSGSSSSSKTKTSSSSSVKSSSSSAKSSSSGKKGEAIVASNIPAFHVFVQGRNIQITNAKMESSLSVFDMQGRIILTRSVNSANYTISLPHAGNFIVNIGNTYKAVQVK